MNKKLAAALIAAALTVPLTGCQNLVQNAPVTCTVTDKDRSTGTNGVSVFRIYTEGCGDENVTLGMADNIFGGGLDTASRYGKIKVGQTYEFKTVGVRNALFSSFREITDFREVTK